MRNRVQDCSGNRHQQPCESPPDVARGTLNGEKSAAIVTSKRHNLHQFVPHHRGGGEWRKIPQKIEISGLRDA
jgi:hypothetical protein